MALTDVPEKELSSRPDRMIIKVPGLSAADSHRMALYAAALARGIAPKLTGGGAKRIAPFWGEGFFGLIIPDRHMWYQERGTNPRTMHELEGKVIPMWIDDPTGKERMSNPKAKVRVTASGKVQVLIFRRAAIKGEKKKIREQDKTTGLWRERWVNKHWPGAPGRIAVREMPKPWTTPGKRGGQIAKGNIGVWWRHPGITPRFYANHAMVVTAQRNGIVPQVVYLADRSWRGKL